MKKNREKLSKKYPNLIKKIDKKIDELKERCEIYNNENYKYINKI